MDEQHSNGGSGGVVPHNMAQQGQSYSMGGLDNMSMGQMSMAGIGAQSQRLSVLDGSSDSLDNLAPIFPPQNFEVPDISFSNSVSPNAEFNQSLLSAAQMFGTSDSLYTVSTAPSGHMMGGQPINTGQQQPQQSHNVMSGQGQQIAMSGQQALNYFPAASNSPPGTSSSEDSDDLPLAQLAKRAGVGVVNSSGGGTSVPSPSASHSNAESTSLENSPTSGTPAKKPKGSKRKKKKDPNEPQKPVSAYALFFRDTQATIKGHNPSASFGEVSKIVASMWDQLDPEHKDVYKKKTEMAKKQYLKQLAAYRANQVSQSASAEETDKSPSPPGVLGTAPGVTTSFTTLGVGPPSGTVMPGSHVPVPMPAQVMGQQRPQIQQKSPPHMMQMMQSQQQQHHMQQMQQQASPSPPSQQHSPSEHSSPPSQAYSSPPHLSHTGHTSYQPAMLDHNNAFGFSTPGMEMDVTYPVCVRSGCGNHARENPAWDSEYCSNDCVITHCRDIFTNWVASRSGTSTFPVK